MLVATRVWPAQEYTRVTFEAAQPIKAQVITLKNPERLVLDLEGIDLNGELTDLAARVRADDPYIKQVRVARNKPTVVRVVLDLKTEVKATLFALPPVGEYRHRLVLDIYPLKPIDPLLALLSAGDIKELTAPVPPQRAMSDLFAQARYRAAGRAQDRARARAEGGRLQGRSGRQARTQGDGQSEEACFRHGAHDHRGG